MTATSRANCKSGHRHFFVGVRWVNHIRQYILIRAINFPHGHIILVCDVWLSNIHSPFFTMMITFHLLNWLFTSKDGNRIHEFITFPTYYSDVRGHISNLISWSTLLFVQFYYILQWSIFHSVCSQCSCCSNSHCTQVPQESWPCKIIVYDNLIIGGLHHRKFAD